ncbi:hypothetical protein [Enterovibrio nigricans]|uniref:hypothetical protein n=1 Tax=Enterovibrio nigricans TaxID=504469 RepID=UPI0011163A28|nr:hypothetical protein [Enterovibrio nigricans]
MHDLPRLTRFKELAEENKEHDAALRFHADEVRIKRQQWDVSSWLFDGLSDYGHSISRPTLLLLATVMGLFFLTFSFLSLP